jgi:plasmid stability protein
MDYLLRPRIIVKNLDAGMRQKKRTRGAFHIASWKATSSALASP